MEGGEEGPPAVPVLWWVDEGDQRRQPVLLQESGSGLPAWEAMAGSGRAGAGPPLGPAWPSREVPVKGSGVGLSRWGGQRGKWQNRGLLPAGPVPAPSRGGNVCAQVEAERLAVAAQCYSSLRASCPGVFLQKMHGRILSPGGPSLQPAPGFELL